MSQENVQTVQRGYEQFAITGEFVTDATPDFVWDMSNFHGWPEQAVYEGVDGAQTFQSAWIAAWDDWNLMWMHCMTRATKSLSSCASVAGRKQWGCP